MINIESEMHKIANELTKLYKDEILKQGLVESGKLLNSIKFNVHKTSIGYSLDMTAVDYFEFLDKKYGITENVFNSSQYQSIKGRIVKLYAQMINDELKNK